MKTADRNKKGLIFNIQKFSINDGPGIRTVVFFKGCPLRCSWCSNPESQLFKPQILYDRKKCILCGHCVEICGEKAISIVCGQIKINHDACSFCGRCSLECPQKALTLEGEWKTVQQVLDTVLQDKPFYEESGGGITLSGGEFLSQPDFAKELLIASKEEGLHTCCETTGYAEADAFKTLISYIDYVLFDLKHWGSKAHSRGTGVSNEIIIRNIKAAHAMGKRILPRIPVIPGFNDSLKDAEGFSRLLNDIGINECQLLPFHQFGENKYSLLCRYYELSAVPALHKEDLQQYAAEFKNYGINAFIK